MNILILMMGGTGTRFGADIPKQYTLINDVPIFAYILKKYDTLEMIDKIIVVSHNDWIEYVNDWIKKMNIKKVENVVHGGSTRSESVLNGLKAANHFANERDVVLIHDTTHPYVDVEGTNQVIQKVKEYGGATLAACQYDTVYRVVDGMIANVEKREEIVSGASPEAFRFKEIFDIYMNATNDELNKMTSAGAIALENGIKMAVIPTSLVNLKITYKNDMVLFKKLYANYFFEDLNLYK